MGGLALSMIVILLCSQTTFVSAEEVDVEVDSIKDNDSGVVSTDGDRIFMHRFFLTPCGLLFLIYTNQSNESRSLLGLQYMHFTYRHISMRWSANRTAGYPL
jgi:hypothetical protein